MHEKYGPQALKLLKFLCEERRKNRRTSANQNNRPYPKKEESLQRAWEKILAETTNLPVPDERVMEIFKEFSIILPNK